MSTSQAGCPSVILILSSSENWTGKFFLRGSSLGSVWGVQLNSSSKVYSRDSYRAEIGIKQETKLGKLNLKADFRNSVPAIASARDMLLPTQHMALLFLFIFDSNILF